MDYEILFTLNCFLTYVWLIGATLLGITIIKLFLVDLAQTSSLARIISFISVGLLTIIVAYFWPAPPRLVTG